MCKVKRGDINFTLSPKEKSVVGNVIQQKKA